MLTYQKTCSCTIHNVNDCNYYGDHVCTCVYGDPKTCKHVVTHHCTCCSSNWRECKSLVHQCICVVLNIDDNISRSISPICKHSKHYFDQD